MNKVQTDNTEISIKADKVEEKFGNERLHEDIVPKVKQEVEETKVSTGSHVEVKPFIMKKLSESLLPKKCVIIVPPLYLDHDVQCKLMEKIGVKSLQYDWVEAGKATQEKNISIVCKFPRVKDKLFVEATTFFLIAGFDDETKIATLKKLESVAEAKDESQYRKQETTFVVSRSKQNVLDALWGNAKTFIDTTQKDLPNNYCELHLSKPEDILGEVDLAFEKLTSIRAALTSEQMKAVKASIEKANGPEVKRKVALFLVPIGMPGMGKTTVLSNLKKLLEEKSCPVTVISSDTIRKQRIEDAMQIDLDLDQDDAFKSVSSDARYQFFRDVRAAIEKTDKLSQDTHVILLDKNHVPQIVGETLKLIQRLRFKTKCKVRTVIINPQCTTDFRTQTTTFPFSLTFFLTCLHRAVGRKDHETLKGTNIQAASVLLGFFKAYKDYRSTEAGLKAFGANFLMEVPFIHEDVEAEKNLPETLVTSFNTLLDTVEEPEEEKIVAFLNELENSQFEPKNPDLNMICEGILDGLTKHFSLF